MQEETTRITELSSQCATELFTDADNRASSSSFCYELLFALQLQLRSMQPVDSACASVIDALLLQCLSEWNGGEEVVKEHVIL